MPQGIITKGIGGFYYISAAEGLYECKARGIFRRQEITPLPGDRVNISVIDEDKKLGSLDEILPRESELVRPAVANVNQVVIVISSKSPQPDFLLLDKLLVTAGQKDLDALICVNKIDLDHEGEYKNIVQAYEKSGYRVILASSKIDSGLDTLKEALKDRISVFAGQSGVGKSTILNRIMNYYAMKTGEISDRLDRGKHTTRHAELIKLDTGGYIVDTPGFSSFELEGISHLDLQLYYPEFQSNISQCRFTGCSHVSEPDCAIKHDLEENKIDAGRYSRYVTFYDALKLNKEYINECKRRK